MSATTATKCALSAKDKQVALRALVKLWIAGTVGGLFSSLVRAIGNDYRTISFCQWDSCYTHDVVARYVYLLWLIAYFFVTGLRLEQKRPLTCGTVLYDIGQSLVSFIAAFSLGFIVTNRGFDSAESSLAFAFVNGAIAFICLTALPFTSDGGAMTGLRASGLAMAGIALLSVCCQPVGPLTPCSMTICALTLLVLWALLLAFGWLRIRGIAS